MPATDTASAPATRPPRFLSDSGRTVGTLDRLGMQRLAEEHEWLRDRVAALQVENGQLRAQATAAEAGLCLALSRP